MSTPLATPAVCTPTSTTNGTASTTPPAISSIAPQSTTSSASPNTNTSVGATPNSSVGGGGGSAADASSKAKVMPQGEKILWDFSCAYFKAGFMHQGRIYMSANYIGFQSSVFSTTVLITVKDIESIAKRNTALLFPNAIEITVKDQKHFFASFLQRNEAYTKLRSLIKGKPSETADSYSDSSDSDDEADHKSTKDDPNEQTVPKTHVRSLSESSPLIGTSVPGSGVPTITISPTSAHSQLPMQLATQLNPASAPTTPSLKSAPPVQVPSLPTSPKISPALPPCTAIQSSLPTSNSSMLVPPTQVPPNLEPPATSQLIGISGTCPHTKYREWFSNTSTPCLEDHLPIPVSQVWPLMLSAGCNFWSSVLEQSSYTDVQIAPWVRHSDGCCNSRALDFITPITSKLTSKKQAPVHQDQTCTFEDGVLTVETIAATRDVPYSDCFVVQSLVRCVPSDSGGCDVLVYCHINFIKAIFFGVKAIAERTASNQTKEFYVVWMKCALEIAQTYQAQPIAGGPQQPVSTTIANDLAGCSAPLINIPDDTQQQANTADKQENLNSEVGDTPAERTPTELPSVVKGSETVPHSVSLSAKPSASPSGNLFGRLSSSPPGALGSREKPADINGFLSFFLRTLSSGTMSIPRNLAIAVTVLFLCLIFILHGKISSQEHQLRLMAEASARTDQGVALVSALLLSLQNNGTWNSKYYEFREWNNRLQMAQESLKRTEHLLTELAGELHGNPLLTDLAQMPYSMTPSFTTSLAYHNYEEPSSSFLVTGILLMCVFGIAVAVTYIAVRNWPTSHKNT
ncbi:GRAM domain-containing protein [Pelomyxa schiedti]|nr:GRAM domain-containing protein [Pelomyxa schiedti]